MTPHEKAIHAINARLERLQANLRDTKVEASQRFLFQSLVGTIAIAEGLNDYAKGVGEYAQRRHGEVKQTNEGLAAQHTELLASGRDLLEKLKANPADRALRKEIERVQRSMEGVQKAVRRGANTLQRELAPSLAMIDQMAESIRRLAEAEQSDALKRVLKTIIESVRELYATHPSLPEKGVIDAAAWETSALSEIDQAAGFHDAYARAGYQTALALEFMRQAVSEHPPHSAEEAMGRASDALAARLKDVTARFAAE